MSEFEYTISSGDQDSNPTNSVQASSLKRGGYVVIDGRPCKITQLQLSETDKIHIVGVDIFRNKKLEIVVKAKDDVETPNVQILEYELVNIEDGMMSLLTSEGEARDDIEVPAGNLGKLIRADYEAELGQVITVVTAMGEKQAVSAAATEVM